MLRWAVAVSIVLALGARSGVGIAGELGGPVLDEGIRVTVEDVVQLPRTSASAPRTRINFLREAPDGTGRLFVNDLRGPLYVIDGDAVSTWLDLQALRPAMNTFPGISAGFVSFAFHPGFAWNGLFYTVHTETPGSLPATLRPPLPTTVLQQAVLTEWTADDPFADTFSGTSRELLRVASRGRDHNLGEVAFSPARPWQQDYGLLYVTGGDYTSAGTGQPDQLQRLDSPYGTILRIDPLGEPFERGGVALPYGIPKSNPFVRDDDPNDHDEGRAIAGGAVYRGDRKSALFGSFVFGDIVSGRLFYADVREMLCARRRTPEVTAPVRELGLIRDGAATGLLELVREALDDPTVARTDLRFGTDARGDVYLTTKRDGWARRLVLEDARSKAKHIRGETCRKPRKHRWWRPRRGKHRGH